ncbi:MAG: ribosomal-processing cysteine protease Prp [Clostridiaceae bacterium]|nr:ribosomal-processing cysteine protease Prp [Clostridiaceae bacterium]
MIELIIAQDREGGRHGFVAKGHANYACREEDDIICAAVTALAAQAIGAVQDLTDVAMTYWTEPGDIGLRLTERKTESAAELEKVDLLLAALEIGCRQIELSYNTDAAKYVEVRVEESAT